MHSIGRIYRFIAIVNFIILEIWPLLIDNQFDFVCALCVTLVNCYVVIFTPTKHLDNKEKLNFRKISIDIDRLLSSRLAL